VQRSPAQRAGFSSDQVVGKNCSQPLAAPASDRPNSGYQ
jgi:hypothetical protein